MVVQPVGPLPDATYWRRRVVVLALLLVVLLVLGLLIRSLFAGGGSGGKNTLKATVAPTKTRTGTTAPTVTPTPAPTRTRAVITPSPPPVAAGACPDASLALTAGADAASYPFGTSPRLTLTVRNTGPVACRRDLGSGAVELVVSSGADRIWSSDDCSPSTASDAVLLAPGASRSVTVRWSGRRSRPGCAGGREQAQPGTYRVVARVGTAHGVAGMFVLAR